MSMQPRKLNDSAEEISGVVSFCTRVLPSALWTSTLNTQATSTSRLAGSTDAIKLNLYIEQRVHFIGMRRHGLGSLRQSPTRTLRIAKRPNPITEIKKILRYLCILQNSRKGGCPALDTHTHTHTRTHIHTRARADRDASSCSCLEEGCPTPTTRQDTTEDASELSFRAESESHGSCDKHGG